MSGSYAPTLSLEGYCQVIESRAAQMVKLARTSDISGSTCAVDAFEKLAVVLHETLPREEKMVFSIDAIPRLTGALVAALRSADSLCSVTWRSELSDPIAWARRLAHATTIVTFDAVDALGGTVDIDDDLALDGIDELMIGLLPRLHPLVLLYDEGGLEDLERLTLDVESAMYDVGWTVTADQQGIATSRGLSNNAHWAVEDSPAELYLALWNRRPLPRGAGLLGERWSRVRFSVDELRQPYPTSLDQRLARAYHHYSALLWPPLGESAGRQAQWFEWSALAVGDRVAKYQDVMPLLDALIAEGSGDPAFLGVVGAGPLEDLLVDRSFSGRETLARAIAERVRRDAAWSEAASNVWCSPEDAANLPAELVDRVIVLPQRER